MYRMTLGRWTASVFAALMFGGLLALVSLDAARAEGMVLSEETCTDFFEWGDSSFQFAWWDEKASGGQCTVESLRLAAGDVLIVPENVTLFQDADNCCGIGLYGTVVNHGTWRTGSVGLRGSFTNYGIVSVYHPSWAKPPARIGLADGAVFDNYGEFFAQKLAIDLSGSGGSSFINRCGSEFTTGELSGTLPTFEDGCDDGTFVDDNDSIFESDIEAIAAARITRGCNPPVNDRFCPDDYVTRAQMAAFISRALELTDLNHPGFIDVPPGSTFDEDIRRIGVDGITTGCNPPNNDRFCPDELVTREQMAAFMVRATNITDLDYSGPGSYGHRGFDDVEPGSLFDIDIRKLAWAGITRGCNPPDNTMFCPTDYVTRAQMAAFMNRAGWGH